MHRPTGGQPEFNLERILGGFGDFIGRLSGRLGGGGIGLGGLVALLLLLVWMATGVYSVGPSEEAALRLFGGYNSTAQPGLHWFPPPPIGQRDIVAVREARTLELGFRSRGTQFAEVPQEALMITGDLNIVDAQLVVQYRISNLKSFLFNVDDPGDISREVAQGRPEGTTLREATEAALRQVVGQRPIDDVLTTGREVVQSETLLLLQEILDGYDTGIQILEVRLQRVRPPEQVRDAFDDVVRARVDKESLINEANAYKEDQIPRARGQAVQVTQAAEAFKAERVATAKGEAARFLSVLTEYRNSREVTRQRLYLEAMEGILLGVNKYIVDAETGGGLLQLLNLNEAEDPLFTPPVIESITESEEGS